MKTSSTAGFTIIETLLVLGVTGALVAGILATVGAGLNVQRYRDSVESFKTLLQSQYSELASVQNDRDNTWSCNGSAQITDTTRQNRGQSNCIMLGKLLSIKNGSVKIYSVVGAKNTAPPATDDITSLQNNYALGVSNIVVEERELEWGTQIAWPGRLAGSDRGSSTTPRELSLLYIRSPDSGHIYTFTGDTVNDTPSATSLRSLVRPMSAQAQQIVCIDPRGLNPPENIAVVIDKYAATPGAIETRSNTLLKESDTSC